jgi:vacuolar protein sorting-associated protein 13A/C
MVGGLGAALTNLKKVPIKLQGLNLNHPFEPVHALTNRVVGHYAFELVYNSYKIFFGTEIFNPIGLLDGVGTGVVNLVTTPFTVQNPEEFAAGTVKNSLKLVQATVGGVFGLIGDTTGALSNVADTLGGGHRAADKTEKPHGVLDGLGHGALGVGKGLFNGVTGVFVKPVEGAMERGALGFVEGVGQGVLGFGGNIVGGVVGGVSDVMSGIAEDIASIGAMVHRPVRRARWYAIQARALVLCCLVSPMRHNALLVLGLRIIHIGCLGRQDLCQRNGAPLRCVASPRTSTLGRHRPNAR